MQTPRSSWHLWRGTVLQELTGSFLHARRVTVRQEGADVVVVGTVPAFWLTMTLMLPVPRFDCLVTLVKLLAFSSL